MGQLPSVVNAVAVYSAVEHAGLDLERMKFDGDFQTIQVDVAVRNYLVATLRAKCQANTV